MSPIACIIYEDFESMRMSKVLDRCSVVSYQIHLQWNLMNLLVNKIVQCPEFNEHFYKKVLWWGNYVHYRKQNLDSHLKQWILPCQIAFKLIKSNFLSLHINKLLDRYFFLLYLWSINKMKNDLHKHPFQNTFKQHFM